MKDNEHGIETGVTKGADNKKSATHEYLKPSEQRIEVWHTKVMQDF